VSAAWSFGVEGESYANKKPPMIFGRSVEKSGDADMSAPVLNYQQQSAPGL